MSGKGSGSTYKGDVMFLVALILGFTIYGIPLALGFSVTFMGVVKILAPIVGTVLTIVVVAIFIRNYWSNRW